MAEAVGVVGDGRAGAAEFVVRRADETHARYRGGNGHLIERGRAEQHVAEPGPGVDAQGTVGVGRPHVAVDDEHRLAGLGDDGGEVDGGGRLALAVRRRRDEGGRQLERRASPGPVTYGGTSEARERRAEVAEGVGRGRQRLRGNDDAVSIDGGDLGHHVAPCDLHDAHFVSLSVIKYATTSSICSALRIVLPRNPGATRVISA